MGGVDPGAVHRGCLGCVDVVGAGRGSAWQTLCVPLHPDVQDAVARRAAQTCGWTVKGERTLRFLAGVLDDILQEETNRGRRADGDDIIRVWSMWMRPSQDAFPPALGDFGCPKGLRRVEEALPELVDAARTLRTR